MAKQNKKTPVAGSSRSIPYSKKPRVDVVFEGAPPPPKPKATPSIPSISKPEPTISKGKGKAKATPSSTITSKSSKSDHVPSAQAAAPTPTPTFKIIAGSYEKLLYGLEGTFHSPSPSSSSAPSENEGNDDFKVELNPIFIFPGHLACVKAVGASPGGKWLATGSEDEFVKVWDLRRRKEVGSLSEHTGSITSITFPTPSHLLASSEDSTISLFRTSDWSLLKSLKGHSGRVNHVDVHPTGRVALSVGKDATLKMWDLMRGRGAASLGLGSEAELVKFSPLGTHFAVLFPKKIQIYSLTLKLLHTLSTKSRFNAVLFATLPSGSEPDAEDKEVLCVGTEKGEVEIYELKIGEDEDGPEKEDEEEQKEGEDLGSGAEVIRIGSLVGHSNRIKQISSLLFYIPTTKEPRKTTLLTSVSSDGYINVYDLSKVYTSTTEDERKGKVVEPLTKYDTKGSRLTCVVLADGGIAKAVAGVDGKVKGPVKVTEDEDDEEDDDDDEEEGDDIYDNEESEEEGSMEVEFEDEDEDEEEGEYE